MNYCRIFAAVLILNFINMNTEITNKFYNALEMQSNLIVKYYQDFSKDYSRPYIKDSEGFYSLNNDLIHQYFGGSRYSGTAKIFTNYGTSEELVLRRVKDSFQWCKPLDGIITEDDVQYVNIVETETGYKFSIS